MSQRYPRAVDLAQMPHCSVCGETNPITDDGGDTTCCARRECSGMGPEAQDVCCQALQDRVDHEAVYGTPPSPVTAKAQARPTPARSTRMDETRDLRDANAGANLVSHQGAPAPTTPAPKEPEMPLSTAAATSAVCRNLFKDGPNSFEPVGYRFGKDRATYEELAKAHLRDASNLKDSTIDGADWDEVFATFVESEPAPAAPAAPELATGSRVTTPDGATGTTTNEPALTPTGWVVSVQYDAPFAHLAASGGADHAVADLTPAPAAAPERPATGWSKHHSSDVYHGYAVMAADQGRVWHLSRHNDEAVCSAKVDRYIGLEDAVALTGICAKCSRYLSRNGAYTPLAARTPQAPATDPAPVAPAAAPAPAPKGARAALGAASAPGWDLLYDKPKAGAEVGRRYVDGKPEFSLICKTHGHVHGLARLSDEGPTRRAGGWCPHC